MLAYRICGRCIITILQCVYTWLILQSADNLDRLVPSETQFRPQNLDPRYDPVRPWKEARLIPTLHIKHCIIRTLCI